MTFCEYAYVGDYTPAQRQHLVTAPLADVAESYARMGESVDEYFGYQPASKRQKKSDVSVFGAFADVEKFCGQCGREAHMHVFWEFKRRDYAVVGPKFRPQECREKSEDNSGLFLYHARVCLR